MSNTGDGDFEAIGKEFLGYFITLGGLTPDDAVLDVGSGIGRMAIPLASYLSKRGRYEGFDIVPEGVRWCQQHLTPRYPRFRFQVADVRNQLYNPKVTASATDYRFPFDDGTFDFCFCTSIFTHLLPDEVSHYLAEISRVLRPGGRCLATFFLAQDGACAGVESPASASPRRVSRIARLRFGDISKTAASTSSSHSTTARGPGVRSSFRGKTSL